MSSPRPPFISVVRPAISGTLYACPCCKAKTLNDRGGYDICPVCFWEADGQDADEVRGGPNGTLSLTQARQNYARIGAYEERFLSNVRPVRPEER